MRWLPATVLVLYPVQSLENTSHCPFFWGPCSLWQAPWSVPGLVPHLASLSGQLWLALVGPRGWYGRRIIVLPSDRAHVPQFHYLPRRLWVSQ